MNKTRCVVVIGLTALLLAGIVYLNMLTGSVGLSAREIMVILTGDVSDEMSRNIILAIRLPRILAAVILGGALALSGYLLQTFFGNPIVGPFVLGISAGAKLTVALTLIFFVSHGVQMGAM
nr:iron ABC transporter permease [Lachnospiraceae bacterium]